MATSRCSRLGRVPGPGVSRNRPCSRPRPPPAARSPCRAAGPGAPVSQAWPAVMTRPSRSSRGGFPIPAAPSWNRHAASPKSRLSWPLTSSMRSCGSAPVAAAARRGVDSVQIACPAGGRGVLPPPPHRDLGHRDPDRQDQHRGLGVRVPGDREPLVRHREEEVEPCRGREGGQRPGQPGAAAAATATTTRTSASAASVFGKLARNGIKTAVSASGAARPASVAA